MTAVDFFSEGSSTLSSPVVSLDRFLASCKEDNELLSLSSWEAENEDKETFSFPPRSPW